MVVFRVLVCHGFLSYFLTPTQVWVVYKKHSDLSILLAYIVDMIT